MHYALTTLHTTLTRYPFHTELAVIGILAFGWILARSGAEYAETLKRPNAGWLLLARLSGALCMLLGLAVSVDSIWSHHYMKLSLVGGFMLAALVLSSISHRLAVRAAREVLLADGYPQPYPQILPKQRGS